MPTNKTREGDDEDAEGEATFQEWASDKLNDMFLENIPMESIKVSGRQLAYIYIYIYIERERCLFPSVWDHIGAATRLYVHGGHIGGGAGSDSVRLLHLLRLLHLPGLQPGHQPAVHLAHI